ncbi:Uncharacterized membrane protein [Amycolatopsis australiensis]|uniref:Uncharacterized membrane protein n=1 Tax=Amycolatopsis australiensis TaxID=546364 RepID=A0A1K1T900_9PSEU|nr:Uncharacterized membrane protein [Amycolatopsis australiensis]
MAISHRPARVLAAVLGFMGVLHFAVPKPFDGLIPRALPGSRRAWTYGSGGAELAVATAVAVPRTRRLGGLLAALLFLGVFPGNVKMAMDARTAPLPRRAIAWARLPLQWPLIAWALKVRDDAQLARTAHASGISRSSRRSPSASSRSAGRIVRFART